MDKAILKDFVFKVVPILLLFWYIISGSKTKERKCQ